MVMRNYSGFSLDEEEDGAGEVETDNKLLLLCK